MTPISLSALVRKYFAAWEAHDRAALEPLLAEDFTFTSPEDDRIGQDAYFHKIWPANEHIRAILLLKLFEQGDEAFVLYEMEQNNGPFQNTEFFRRRDDKIVSVQVFFGDDLGGSSAD